MVLSGLGRAYLHLGRGQEPEAGYVGSRLIMVYSKKHLQTGRAIRFFFKAQTVPPHEGPDGVVGDFNPSQGQLLVSQNPGHGFQ